MPSDSPKGRKNRQVPTERAAKEAAALMHRLLDLLPPAPNRDAVLRQRVEGAAIGLEALAGADGATENEGAYTQREPFMYRISDMSESTIAKRAKKTRSRPLALGYIRVSTEEQADDGASLPAQRQRLTEEAERRGWDIEISADEGKSAKSIENRPALLEALGRLDAGAADILLVLRVDRLSRSVSDFASLMARSQKRHWSLVALDLGVDTSTPAGDLMAHVLASVAQYERKVIGQRTKEGMAQRRAEGVHVGRPSSLPESVVGRIVAERASGATLGAIAQHLTAEAVPTATGGRWHASTVARVLDSAAAKRLAESEGTYYLQGKGLR